MPENPEPHKKPATGQPIKKKEEVGKKAGGPSGKTTPKPHSEPTDPNEV